MLVELQSLNLLVLALDVSTYHLKYSNKDKVPYEIWIFHWANFA